MHMRHMSMRQTHETNSGINLLTWEGFSLSGGKQESVLFLTPSITAWNTCGISRDFMSPQLVLHVHLYK